MRALLNTESLLSNRLNHPHGSLEQSTVGYERLAQALKGQSSFAFAAHRAKTRHSRCQPRSFLVQRGRLLAFIFAKELLRLFEEKKYLDLSCRLTFALFPRARDMTTVAMTAQQHFEQQRCA